MVKDARMTFQEHLNRTSERAMKAIFALSRIMSNIGGPRYTTAKITLLANVYGAPICGNVANVAKICSSYRISALRVTTIKNGKIAGTRQLMGYGHTT